MDLPDRWLVLSVPAPPRGEEHLLVEALLRLGSRSVEPRGERYVAFLTPPVEMEALLGQARSVIRASTSLGEPELAWRWAPREGWIGDGASGPPTSVAVGGDREILLRPGLAFGTGDHPTTRACLSLLEGLVEPGERWADVGAGTGILAMAAALLGAGEILALEADSLAVALGRENVALNRLQGRITVRELRVGPADLGRLDPFHGIAANIEAETLLTLLEGFREALHPGGRLVLSGAHRGEGAELRERAGDLGLQSVEEVVEGGWWAGAFRADL